MFFVVGLADEVVAGDVEGGVGGVESGFEGGAELVIGEEGYGGTMTGEVACGDVATGEIGERTAKCRGVFVQKL